MKLSLELYSELVRAIYDAALDATKWDTALARMVNAFDAHGGALLTAGPTQRRFVNATIGTDNAAVKSYNDYYGRLDPVAVVLERVSAGTVVAGHEVISETQQHKSEFYNDWAARIDAGDGVFARLIQGHNSIGWLCLAAPLRASRFGTDDRVALMRLLVPHLQHSLRTQNLLGGIANDRNAAYAALDHLEHSIVLIARNGQVVFANATASALCRKADGLTITRDRMLHAARRDDDGALQRQVGAATSPGHVGSVSHGGSLMINRPSGLKPLALHVLPLAPRDAPFSMAGATGMIVIVDSQREPRASVDMLGQLFRLTHAEAAVASLVLRGEGLQYIADELSVTLSTVRIHLQRVFEKTGTHRQTELASLLLRLQAGLERQRGPTPQARTNEPS